MSSWLERGLAILLISMVGVTPVLAAETIPAPVGKVILSLSDESRSNSVDIDFAGLEALPALIVRTTTPWTEGEQVFEGVLLRDLLEAAGVQGGTLKAVALNDYFIDIPRSDARDFDVIVAYRHNGERMSVRDKGPLWIIYPDTQAGPNAQSRMVWQLRRIEARR